MRRFFHPAWKATTTAIWTASSAILGNRIRQEPFNLVATLIFLLAIVHTFLTGRFMVIAHRWDHEHKEKIKRGQAPRGSVTMAPNCSISSARSRRSSASGRRPGRSRCGVFRLAHSKKLHFLGQFHRADVCRRDHDPGRDTPDSDALGTVHVEDRQSDGRNDHRLVVGDIDLAPILGSFITEPAAMTIAALLLAEKFYSLSPSTKFKYATLGLLFVNISVGGTLTSFAAPPVLMVVRPGNGTPSSC